MVFFEERVAKVSGRSEGAFTTPKVRFGSVFSLRGTVCDGLKNQIKQTRSHDLHSVEWIMFINSCTSIFSICNFTACAFEGQVFMCIMVPCLVCERPRSVELFFFFPS